MCNLTFTKNQNIMKKLNRSLLKHVSGGGRVAYAFCMIDEPCPRPPGIRRTGYCEDGICYYDTSTGPGNPGGCTEPQRLCSEGEVGCGCVYV